MPQVELTKRQSKVFKMLDKRHKGEFVLDEAIEALYGDELPEHSRQKTISVINSISKKFKCKCCHIKRVNKLGRGRIGVYEFRINCSSEDR